ncbi:TetR family transcriptional regulator [Streptomyces sp. NPDC051913]|uniref:TetR family transcriptional regulator n=1 Tax=Streptomyces sp. NPDC051913 TaxID=3365676 RepID=UPI0037D88F8C
MTAAGRTNTRDIARAAVRAELGQVAFELFRRDGFDKVTVDDLARAAGVSRSTFLRYFATKEDAVLSALESDSEAKGERVAEALRARAADEDDWTALRRVLAKAALEPYHQDPAAALALTRLIRDTPALCDRRLAKQHRWRPALAHALAERGGSPEPTLAHWVRASAALDCLNAAVDHWSDSEGTLDLVGLLNEAFAALAPEG